LPLYSRATPLPIVGQPRPLPAGEAPALQIASLRAFFERAGLTAQMCQHFAGEMK